MSVCVPGSGRVCVRTFGDAVLCGQEPLLQEALQHRADRGPVDQLEHKQVGLWRREDPGGVSVINTILIV